MDRNLTNYALYRLPEQSQYTYVAQADGMPSALQSVAELTGQKGFVIAPFAVSEHHPVVIIRPDIVERRTVPTGLCPTGLAQTLEEKPEAKAAYAEQFGRFHTEVEAGEFGKLVLSRCTIVDRHTEATPEDLFLRACQCYPHQFVALVSTPMSGTWLMATPEVMLCGRGGKWRTMALAGTMRQTTESAEPLWSEKNIEEQRYVSAYIEQTLETFATNIAHQGPYTTQAAHLLHLRTDYSFHLRRTEFMGPLLEALYPTPAVCGLPKEEAKAFIAQNEKIDRKYYSGFCGPLNMHNETHLFVSLRCMEILGHSYHLYAGGGIMPESDMETEWRETQGKLQTMHHLLTL